MSPLIPSAKKEIMLVRDFLSKKTLAYLGNTVFVVKQINLFKKSFKNLKLFSTIDELVICLDTIDCIVCYESHETSKFLKKVRGYNQNIPFIIISNDDFQSNPIQYIKDNLSYYIHSDFSNAETMYIIEHEIHNYETSIKNKLLKNEHQTYLDMLDNIVIISRTDLKGRITYANDIFCEVSGYSQEELLGKHHNILRHPEVPSSIFQNMWETILSNQTWTGVVKNLDKDKKTYVAKSIISPYYHNNEKIGYLGIRYLITDEIEEKRKLKSNFTKLIIENKTLLKEKDKTIQKLEEELKLSNQNDDSYYKNRFELLQTRVEKLQTQVNKYEVEFATQSKMHEQKVSLFLREKREYNQNSSEKIFEINGYKEEIKNLEIDLEDCKNTLYIEQLKQVKLNDEIIKLNDIINHQDGLLLKLEK